MYQYLFGPVPSRRLGMSLGVDLVPHKICSLNCVYCECGATTRLTSDRKEYVPTQLVLDELTDFLDNNPAPDVLTFSGAGEPTLHINSGFIINTLKSRFPDIKIAVLTNATSLVDDQVRAELLHADLLLPSLDAISDEVFRKINRPVKKIQAADVIDGIAKMREIFAGEIWLEVLIIPGYNDSLNELTKFKTVLPTLSANKIQLNTLDRPGTLKNIRAASFQELQSIQEFLGLPNLEIVSKSKIFSKGKFHSDTLDNIIKTISRRPCTLDDLVEMLGITSDEVHDCLQQLEKEGRLEFERQERGLFFKYKK